MFADVQEIQRRQRCFRVGGHAQQNSLEAPDQPVDGGRVEHVAVELDAQTQFRARKGLDGERVVVVVVSGHLGDVQPARARQRGDIDRKVLVHEQRVKEYVVPGDSVDLAERQMLMLEGVVVGAVQPAEQLRGVGGRREGGAHRHRVDEQPDHRLGTGHLGRPPRDGGAEGDVVVTGQAPQQLRKSRLQNDVDGGVAGTRQLVESPRGGAGYPEQSRAPGAGARVGCRTDQGGGVEAPQCVPPGFLGGHTVSVSKPGYKPPIGRGRG